MSRYTTLSQSRAICTLLPVLCGNGSVVPFLLFQRCQSITVDAAKFTAARDMCVAVTETAQQSDSSWLNFAQIWLPQCNASFSSPSFVYLDDHSRHVTWKFIQFAAQHGLYEGNTKGVAQDDIR